MDEKADTPTSEGSGRVHVPRRVERLPIEVALVVSQPRLNRLVPAELFDLSRLGCRFLSEEPFEPGAQVLIRIEGLEDWPGKVIWSGPEGVGVNFHLPLEAKIVEQYAATFPRDLADRDEPSE